MKASLIYSELGFSRVKLGKYVLGCCVDLSVWEFPTERANKNLAEQQH